MKSQHRHELQTNDLSRLVEQVKQWYDEHGTGATVGVLAILVLMAIGTFWVRSSRASRSQAWSAFAMCRTAADFENVADDFDGTEVAAWARLNSAERQLDQGVQLMFTDRSAAISELKNAEDLLNTLLGSSATPERVRERALMALARLRETVCDGNVQPAVQLYQQLLGEFPDSAFRETAQRRIDALQTGNSQEFYAWFHEQNPKPADIEKPRDLSQSGATGTLDVPSTSESTSATRKVEGGGAAGPALNFPEAPTQPPNQPASDAGNVDAAAATSPKSPADSEPASDASKPAEDQAAEPAAKNSDGADKTQEKKE